MANDTPQLARSVRFPFLLVYGVGTMVGGGFYALSGKVAGQVGLHAPLAFGLPGLLALLSALSYAELAGRLPHSGGSARYVEHGFGSRRLSAVVGWLLIATGVISAATLAVATAGFLNDLVTVPQTLANLALWRIKRREPTPRPVFRRYPGGCLRRRRCPPPDCWRFN